MPISNARGRMQRYSENQQHELAIDCAATSSSTQYNNHKIARLSSKCKKTEGLLQHNNARLQLTSKQFSYSLLMTIHQTIIRSQI